LPAGCRGSRYELSKFFRTSEYWTERDLLSMRA
jgi:hypothetical protein